MLTLLNNEDKCLEIHKKQIFLALNGEGKHLVSLKFNNSLRITDILFCVQKKMNRDVKMIRIFNKEGVEYEQDDLPYVKNNQILYISRGQQFDVKSCFGEYEFIKILGQGGFGRVQLCRHQLTGQMVAIKHLRADKVTAQRIDMIFRETEHLKALDHPNIVKILSCYAPKGLDVVFIMEYIEGGQLLQLVKNKQHLTEQQAKVIMRQIVSAIFYCHFKNIVHRDLKLQNILLRQKCSLDVKIADFGISGISEKFNPDAGSGTLKYMCPQVLSGAQKGNSPAVDVWAMGCILYYMLFGKHPFSASNRSQIYNLIVAGSYKIPTDIEVSADVVSLLRCMLDINPKTRIKVPDILDHPWLTKYRLFKFRNSRKNQERNSRKSLNVGARRSQIPQNLSMSLMEEPNANLQTSAILRPIFQNDSTMLSRSRKGQKSKQIEKKKEPLKEHIHVRALNQKKLRQILKISKIGV